GAAEPRGLAFRRGIEGGQDSPEVAVADEVANARYGELVPEQRLGRHHDQRLAENATHLPAQNVEVVGRSRAVRNLQIVIRAELQVTLEPGRAVLRPLPLVSVRK